MFMIPRRMRHPAETEAPMMPPILLKAPNLELMAEAVAATIIDVITTILQMKSTLERLEFIRHEAACCINIKVE